MDKVQIIREEVERLKSQLLRGACSSQIAMETMCKEEAYNEVLALLDTMQEEPKHRFNVGDKVQSASGKIAKIESVDTDKYWCVSERGMTIPFKYQDKWELVKEPVSEDLEEAADNALSNVLNTHEIVNVRSCLEMFRLGAKWQKTKDKQILSEEGVVILPEEEFERMKRSLIKLAEREQQMMAKAIDGDITFDYYGNDNKTYGCIAHDSFCLEDFGLKDRDKVKMILIKEG